MKCPHCSISFHDNWQVQYIYRDSKPTIWQLRAADCPACKKLTIELGRPKAFKKVGGIADGLAERLIEPDWFQVFPKGSSRGPVPSEVPQNLARNYTEACDVLPISAKASAALARRCLQTILHDHGYKDRDLAKEIDLILNEKDPDKALPRALREMIDGVRNFGNFSAHPITDKTSLQVIDVEPHEAEWCLDIIEEMFQHFYVQPAARAARKAALDAKLAAAGKPASK